MPQHRAPAAIPMTERRTRALVPVLIFVGMVVSVVGSLGAPLIPSISTDYHVSVSGAQWSLTIALLVGAVTAPVMGRLSDGPHRRRVILSALTLVVLGSVLAGLPLSFSWLLVGRGLQGVGFGLVPLAMTVARAALPAQKSQSTVAILSITAAAGVGLGYPITGLFADHFGFHAPFWFGAAVSALALLAAALVLPATGHLTRLPIDVIGAVLLGLGLISVLLCLSEGSSWGWTSAPLLGLALGAVVILSVWVWLELRRPFPLVNLRLMRNRAVLTANVTGLFAGLGMYMLLPLVTRFVQAPVSTGYGFGSTIVVAGLVLLPFSVGSVLASRVLPMVARRLGPFWVMPVGPLLMAASMLLFAVARGALWEMFVVMAVAGVGVGLTFAAIPGLIVRSVPAGETGSALGINQVVRQIGLSIGSALGGMILAQHTLPGSVLPSDSGYDVSAIVGIAVSLVTGVLGFVLPSRHAAEIPPAVEIYRPAAASTRVPVPSTY